MHQALHIIIIIIINFSTVSYISVTPFSGIIILIMHVKIFAIFSLIMIHSFILLLFHEHDQYYNVLYTGAREKCDVNL